MRSKLFVPGTRPELFAKALAGRADAVSFDLEDAVTEPRKAEARAAVSAFLRAGGAVGTAKKVIVRVNAMDTPHFTRDIESVVLPGVHLVNLPKPHDRDGVVEACRAIERAEREQCMTEPVGLLLNIETPLALRTAARLATADRRVVGLQLGLGDLFEPFGMDRREPSAIRQAMFAVRMAAGEAGIDAFDGAFADIEDLDGFRAEADLARRLGLVGKTCIHPSQIDTANEVFRPTDAEIAHAVKVVDAAHRADRDGIGAYVVDGKMIDIPFVRRARDIVESARGLGLLNA